MATPSQPQPVPIILILLLLPAAASTLQAEQNEQQPITLPGCPDRCGDTRIPFPFGTKPGCFREGFQVTCNESFRPHRAFLAYAGVNQHIAEIYWLGGWYRPVRRIDHDNMALELIDISVANGEARAYGLVSSICNAANLISEYIIRAQNMALGEKSPFLLSLTRNLLIGVGRRVEPQLTTYRWQQNISGYAFSVVCLSDLSLLQQATNGSCSGQAGCCQAALLWSGPITKFGLWFNFADNNSMWQTNPCSYAILTWVEAQS